MNMGDQDDGGGGGGLTMNSLLSEVQNTLDKIKLEDDGPVNADYSPYANLGVDRIVTVIRGVTLWFCHKETRIVWDLPWHARRGQRQFKDKYVVTMMGGSIQDPRVVVNILSD
ncbi:hypothetical protein ACHAXH_005942 [Discostella pseudostelligera]